VVVAAYRPVCFQPFYARPIIVTRVVQPVRVVEREREWHSRWGDRMPDRRVEITPYRPVPESRRMPIIGPPPRLGHPEITPPQRFVDHARVMGPRVETTPYRPIAESRRMPIVQSRPAVTQQAAMQPPRFAERRAQLTQNAAQVQQRMPAPQVRVSERPIGVGHSGTAQASGNRGGG